VGRVVERIRALEVMDHSHTGRKGLLELVGLVAVLEDKGVDLAAAADLELDLLVGVLLHARSCWKTQKSAKRSYISPYSFTACASFAAIAHIPAHPTLFPPYSIQPISRVGCKRTGSILAAADLDEALDVGDFAGHVGGIV
jgi:hypothetical protein